MSFEQMSQHCDALVAEQFRSFGNYMQAVVVSLKWHEHANALLYTNGAPNLLNIIYDGFQKKLPILDTVQKLNDALNGKETCVTIENGKYTFKTMPGDYRIHVLRHGEPWLILDQGSKAILALMQAVEKNERI